LIAIPALRHIPTFMTKWKGSQYPFFVKGDLNAFFALFLDNLVNLVILSGILIGVFNFPENIIFSKMIPGTALGVLIGNLFYSFMAVILANKTKRNDITAMPLGLDTPSTIGIAVAILGPSFTVFNQTMPAQEAGILSWHVGMAVMILMGILKIIVSFLGEKIQKAVPEAALLGSLAGIGIVFLSANHIYQVMEIPLVGMISLIIIILTLFAKHRLPKGIPGAAAAVLTGSFIYYILAAFNLFNLKLPILSITQASLPRPYIDGFSALFSYAGAYWPLAIPFGLLTIVGGINVTESAKVAGDNYNVRNILLTEAFATLIAGIFGGVSQTTPYIGHSAYKKMGAKAGYTFFTGLLIGLGGFLGLIGLMVKLIPESAVAPILIYIGLEITALAYQMSPARHNMAVSAAIIPSILYFGYIKLKSLYEPLQFTINNLLSKPAEITPAVKDALAQIIPFTVAREYPYLQALSQGFIITAMIWGSLTSFLIDNKIKSAVIVLLIAAAFSFFGFIHSATSSGELYLPWHLTAKENIPYKFSISYLGGALFLLFISKYIYQEKKK